MSPSYAIISDIHANLSALRAVLADIRSQGEGEVTKILCLGDLVGYYTQPIPVIHLTLAKCENVIKGNHDHAAALGEVPSHFQPDSFGPLDWTNQKLSIRERKMLHALPLMHTEKCGRTNKKLMLIHGGPEYPLDQYIFPHDHEDIKSTFEFMELIEVDLLFLGHTHVPMLIENQDGRIICNPGSVGQPRDGNSQPCYVLYDLGTEEITFHRVSYDPTTTINGIKEHHFATELADRLLTGE